MLKKKIFNLTILVLKPKNKRQEELAISNMTQEQSRNNLKDKYVSSNKKHKTKHLTQFILFNLFFNFFFKRNSV